MYKNWLCIALRHQNAELAIREKYALQEMHRPLIYAYLAQILDAPPAFLAPKNHDVWCLITCNRCEVYLEYEVSNLELGLELTQQSENSNLNSTLNSNSNSHLDNHLKVITDCLLKAWADVLNVHQEVLVSYVDVYTGFAAIEHLFEVSSGLDSMVLGETQITHQIKQQIQHKPVGGLTLILQKSLECAKKVRSHTVVSTHSTSMAAIALRLAKHVFTDLNQQNILLIGAGMMMQQIAPYFIDAHPKNIHLLNRSYSSGMAFFEKCQQHLANHAADAPTKIHFNTLSTDALSQAILGADIIIICTSSPTALISQHQLKQNLKKRKYTPLYCVDLAVPRNIEVGAESLDSVFLYTVEDLGRLANQGENHRQQAKSQATVFILEQVNALKKWYAQQQNVALIQLIQNYFNTHMPHEKKMRHLWLKHIQTLNPQQNQQLSKQFEGLLAQSNHSH